MFFYNNAQTCYSYSSKGKKDAIVLIKRQGVIIDTLNLYGFSPRIYNDTDLVLKDEKYISRNCSLDLNLYFSRIIKGHSKDLISIKLIFEIDSTLIQNQSDLVQDINKFKNTIILEETCDFISSCKIEIKKNSICLTTGHGLKRKRFKYIYNSKNIKSIFEGIEYQLSKKYPRNKYFYKVKREMVVFE
jgi:hypothetical protein